LSIEELANDLKITPKAYEEFESGQVDIPVGFLYELAGKFKVELTAILTGEGPKLHTYALVREGKGVNVERREHYKYQSLAYNFANKKSEPFMVTVPPLSENDPIHFNNHPGQEFNYVIEGVLKVVINGHELILNEGDSLYFDSSVSHGMKAIGDKPAKFLALILKD
jgi:quercetin dioxygenase-like cupin family protein